MADAAHEEENPDGEMLLVSKMACSLVGVEQKITFRPKSVVHKAYGRQETRERYVCSYGLNPQFRDKLEKGSLNITGEDAGGEVRVIELSGHPFFVATLYQPQLSSNPGKPHPLMVAFIKTAISFKESISPPSLDEFDDLIAEVRRKGKQAGIQKTDIDAAIGQARGKNQ